MKKILISHLTIYLLLLLPILNFAQPDLRSTSRFALFTTSGAFNVAGASTVVVGDVGNNVGAFSGFPPGTLVGQRFLAGDPISATAASDLNLVYGDLSATMCGIGGVLVSTLGDGQILTPNVYCHGAATTLNGVLTLDGGGNSNAIFIIKINGALSTNSGSSINLTNGAHVCNVYWQINGAVHLGSSFLGTIVAAGEIELLTGASLTGRGLTTAGAINLRGNNSVSLPTPTATVITAGSAITFCAGMSVVLSGNNGGVWSIGGSSASSITATTTGDYFVTNTNGCGSVTSNHIMVTVNPVLTPATIVASGPVTFCVGASVTLSGNVGGIWSNGATTPSITVNASGNFSVTNTNACGSVTSNHIIVTVNPLPVVSVIAAGGPIVFCVGGSVVLSGNNGGVWSTSATTPSITVTTAGDYFVTTTNSCGSVTSNHIMVTVNSPLTASVIAAAGPTKFCTGQTVVLSGNTNNGIWSNGATTASILVIASGDFFVTNTNSCGSVISNHIIVNVGALTTPSIITANDAVNFCVGDSVTLSGNINGIWSTGATTASIVVKTSGDYFVSNTDTCGIATSNHIIVKVDLPPTASIIIATDTTSFCPPDSVILSGNVGGVWNTGATTASITVKTSGDFFVTNSNSCATLISNHILVNVSPLPVASVLTSNKSTTICIGDSIILTGNIGGIWNTGATTVSITVKTTGVYFVTNFNFCDTVISNIVPVQVDTLQPASTIIAIGPTFICPGDSVILSGNVGGIWNTGATTSSITVKTSGDFFVTNSNACATLISNHIIVNVALPLPPFTISASGATSFCIGDSVRISGNNGGIWNTGATTSFIIVKTSGDYFAINSNSCDSAISNHILVTVNTLPIVFAGINDTICVGQSLTLGTSFIAGHTYKWITRIGIFVSNLANPIVSPTGTTTYILNETITASGCKAADTVTVTVGPNPNCMIKGNNIICEGQSTTLCAPSGAFTYLWSTGATTSCITVNSIGNYTVVVTNSLGCSSICGRNVIRGEGPCLITGNGFIYLGQSTEFCAPTGYASYKWSSGETTRCITAKTAGTYAVTVTNARGCISVCSRILTVAPAVYCEIIGDTIICPNSTATLCAVSVSGNSYFWNNGQTSQCIEINCEGTYSVTITNNGASSICIIRVILAVAPTASLTSLTAASTASLTSCVITGNLRPNQGDSTTLCAPEGYSTYLWSTGAKSRCIKVGSSGSYVLKVSKAGGCSHTCSALVSYPASRRSTGISSGIDPVINPGKGIAVVTKAHFDIKVYPNPFNTSANFEFQTDLMHSHIKLEMTGLTGNKIATIFDSDVEKGIVYKASFDGSRLSEGIYFYRMINGNQIISKKLVLVK